MRRFRAVSMLVTAVATAGCQSTTPENASVIATGNPELVRGCEFLGQATGSERLIGGIALGGVARDNAVRRLRNEAAKRGATHLLTTETNTGLYGADATGDLYRCRKS